ncbi:hypothetical protein DICVIV_06136 [Dictyocaulus viviparus]|uniref:Uncharacterized protein n=1 Tax=Dictyocaulus viviparus TaxID=29172 RepID=A0A0D8XT47_DICVI|nr:hypothetical protein DICVIV_06136 [Dictyocaulus viviparus]
MTPHGNVSIRSGIVCIDAKFHNLTVFPRRAFVVLSAKDGGNILRDDYVDEVIRFDNLITAALADQKKSKERSCDPLCDLNRPFHLIIKELRSNETGTDRELGYPESTFHDTSIFIGMHFHDVNIVPGTKKFEAKSVILWYFSRVDTPERKQIYKDITLDLFRISNDGSFSDLIDFHIFGDEIANSEMVRGALELQEELEESVPNVTGYFLDVYWFYTSSSLRYRCCLEANNITCDAIFSGYNTFDSFPCHHSRFRITVVVEILNLLNAMRDSISRFGNRKLVNSNALLKEIGKILKELNK